MDPVCSEPLHSSSSHFKSATRSESSENLLLHCRLEQVHFDLRHCSVQTRRGFWPFSHCLDISAELIHISVLVYQLLARKLQRADLLLRFIPFSFFPVPCVVWSLIYLLLFYPWLVFVFESTTFSVFALCCSVSVFVKYLLKKKRKKERDSFFFLIPRAKLICPGVNTESSYWSLSGGIHGSASWFCFRVPPQCSFMKCRSAGSKRACVNTILWNNLPRRSRITGE